MQSWAHAFEVTRDDREPVRLLQTITACIFVRMSLEHLVTLAGLGKSLARVAEGGSAHQSPEPLVTITSRCSLL